MAAAGSSSAAGGELDFRVRPEFWRNLLPEPRPGEEAGGGEKPGGDGIPKAGDELPGQEVGVFLGLELLAPPGGEGAGREGLAADEGEHPRVGAVDRLESFLFPALEGGEPGEVVGEKQSRRVAEFYRRAARDPASRARRIARHGLQSNAPKRPRAGLGSSGPGRRLSLIEIRPAVKIRCYGEFLLCSAGSGYFRPTP
jgi:hypothetical protein